MQEVKVFLARKPKQPHEMVSDNLLESLKSFSQNI